MEGMCQVSLHFMTGVHWIFLLFKCVYHYYDHDQWFVRIGAEHARDGVGKPGLDCMVQQDYIPFSYFLFRIMISSFFPLIIHVPMTVHASLLPL